MQGNTNSNNLGFGIYLNGGTRGHEIKNNIIQNNIAGLSLSSLGAGDTTEITQNVFRDNNNPGPISGTGIYTDQFNGGGPATNVLIADNEFTNLGLSLIHI